MAKTIRTPSEKCVDCGNACWGRTRHGKQQQPRCRACACRHRAAQRDSNERTCIQPDCDRPVQARGYCAPHYATWHRSQRKYQMQCERCGLEFMADRPSRVTCSRSCGATNGSDAAKLAPRTPRPKVTRLIQCVECHGLFVTVAGNARKTCSNQCQEEAALRRSRAQRGPLRKALEDGDHARVLELITARTTATATGCHIWQGRLDAGYPVVQIGSTRPLVHRLVLEAVHQAPLGVQAAHHKCATPACVNPEHLQPVTHRDNVAEMLARNTYIDRIAELELALAELEPEHPALHRIRTA